MELDLIRTFLLNARRALNIMDQLFTPSLANIQAFLSMVSPHTLCRVWFTRKSFANTLLFLCKNKEGSASLASSWPTSPLRVGAHMLEPRRLGQMLICKV